MATLTIRNLDDEVKAKLQAEAKRNGCSMEEQARIILRQALEKPLLGLGSRIHSRFAAIGGVTTTLEAVTAVSRSFRVKHENTL